MNIARLTNEYDLVAPLYGCSADELSARDSANHRSVGRWVVATNGTAVAAVMAWVRPDDRVFLSFVGDADVRGRLGRAASIDLDRKVHTLADGDDVATLASLTDVGFVTEMESEAFVFAFDAALRWLRRGEVPPGFALVPAHTVDEDRLFALDNRLRCDVPGSDGWTGDRAWFHEELTESPPYDPTAYLVALHEPSGEYAGLVRIWRNRSGPRLGLIGVLPEYRRTMLAASLLRHALHAAAAWGHPTFTTETSISNRVIYPRLKRLGAERTGRFLQMVLP